MIGIPSRLRMPRVARSSCAPTTTRSNVTDPIYFTVTYKAPDEQTGIVRITSTQDTAGFDITVTETGADTGVFEGMFTTADVSDDGG